jgi:hypothetical protein
MNELNRKAMVLGNKLAPRMGRDRKAAFVEAWAIVKAGPGPPGPGRVLRFPAGGPPAPCPVQSRRCSGGPGTGAVKPGGPCSSRGDGRRPGRPRAVPPGLRAGSHGTGGGGTGSAASPPCGG